ncbi:hypothetical protein SDC9_47556 [bioreactor metagenome]|uniref:Acetylglutamate kinase n=1 Tax=bioreactor metagenome TaxID=1076179 RepID=A0A644WBW1_9ZZZZ
MYRNNNCAVPSNLSPKQQQLYNTLRRLWMEHVLWTRFFIVSTAFDLPDLEYVTNRLLRNPADFAYVLRPLYGSERAMRFANLLTDHLQIAGQLVNAAKAGDTGSADRLREKWYLNASEIASFLSELNPCWDVITWRELLYDHLKMTENEATYILSGEYTAGIDQYAAIQEEALIMADVMARGIIGQFRI